VFGVANVDAKWSAGLLRSDVRNEPVQINVVIGSASLPPSFPEQRHLLFSVLPSSGVLPI